MTDITAWRLSQVADILEFEEDTWYQGSWAQGLPRDYYDEKGPVHHLAVKGRTCNATCCIAGHAVALVGEELPHPSTLETMIENIDTCGPDAWGWHGAGRWALGLTLPLATLMFYGFQNSDRDLLVEILRTLAKLAPERSILGLLDAASPSLRVALETHRHWDPGFLEDEREYAAGTFFA